MPSGEHESPLELARQDPGLIAWLLTDRFGVAVPAYDHARPHTTEVRELIPHTYHADGVVAWYERRLTDQIGSLPLRPFFVTPSRVPLVTDPGAAEANPTVAVLAAVLHGHDPAIDQAFPALAQTILALGPEQALLYYDVALAGLPRPARQRWETYMTTIPTGYTFRSELFRTAAAEGKAEGEAEGKAEAVLAVLEARGLNSPEPVRERILATTDLGLLDTWLRRAATATRLEDVLGDADRA